LNVIWILLSHQQSSKKRKLKEDEKEETSSISVGVHCVGYRSAVDVDYVEHRYYDLACWNINTNQSIISRVTERHRSLLDFTTELQQKLPILRKTIFPGKQLGGKDKHYYASRFRDIKKYFETISHPDYFTVQNDTDFQTFFKLTNFKTNDFQDEQQNELLFRALESYCDSKMDEDEINYQSCKRKGERLGIDNVFIEMLKIIAIATKGKNAILQLNQIPNHISYTTMQNKFKNEKEKKLQIKSFPQ